MKMGIVVPSGVASPPVQSVPLLAGASVALTTTQTVVPHARMRLLASDWDLGVGKTPQYRLVGQFGEGLLAGDAADLLLLDPNNGNLAIVAALLAFPSSPGSSAGTTPDASSNNRTGALVGVPVLSAAGASILGAAWGQSVAFAGVNGASADGIDGGATGFAWSTAGTLEARGVKRGRTGVAEVFCGLYTVGGNESQYAMYFDATGHLTGIVRTGAGAVVTVAGAATIDTSAAHDCALAWDGTTLRLLLDGALAASAALASINAAPTAHFWVGRDGQTTTDAFQGSIDEVHVSNVARYTAAYTPATGPFTPDANTLALYHLDTLTPGADPNAVAFAATAWTAVPAVARYATLATDNRTASRGTLLGARLEVRYV